LGATHAASCQYTSDDGNLWDFTSIPQGDMDWGTYQVAFCEGTTCEVKVDQDGECVPRGSSWDDAKPDIFIDAGGVVHVDLPETKHQLWCYEDVDMPKVISVVPPEQGEPLTITIMAPLDACRPLEGGVPVPEPQTTAQSDVSEAGNVVTPDPTDALTDEPTASPTPLPSWPPTPGPIDESTLTPRPTPPTHRPTHPTPRPTDQPYPTRRPTQPTPNPTEEVIVQEAVDEEPQAPVDYPSLNPGKEPNIPPAQRMPRPTAPTTVAPPEPLDAPKKAGINELGFGIEGHWMGYATCERGCFGEFGQIGVDLRMITCSQVFFYTVDKKMFTVRAFHCDQERILGTLHRFDGAQEGYALITFDGDRRTVTAMVNWVENNAVWQFTGADAMTYR